MPLLTWSQFDYNNKINRECGSLFIRIQDICVGVEFQNKESKGIMTIAITHTNESWITWWIQNQLYELMIMNKWDVR